MATRLVRGDGWSEIERWLVDEIGGPDHRLGRTGPRCPFIHRALRSNALLYDTDPTLITSVPQLSEIMLARVKSFKQYEWPNTAPELQALVVTFPGLGPDDAGLLDAAHQRCKGPAILAGFMLAQFHPRSDVRSVRNQSVRAGISPVPLIAIRRMAAHDDVFLEDNPDWNSQYFERFGAVSEPNRK